MMMIMAPSESDEPTGGQSRCLPRLSVPRQIDPRFLALSTMHRRL